VLDVKEKSGMDPGWWPRSPTDVLPTRRRAFALILVLSNLSAYAVFVALAPRSASGNMHPLALVLAGAKVSDLVLSGQWWRLVSSVFLHADPVHLLVNCLGMYLLARMADGVFGWVRVLVIYVASGAAGAMASVFWSPEPSVGASGAIYGLLGAIAVYAVAQRRRIPRKMQRVLAIGTVIWVGISVIYTTQATRIDSAAHLGGALAGVLIAISIRGSLPGAGRPAPPASKAFKAAAVLCGLAVAVSAGMSVRGLLLDFDLRIPAWSQVHLDGVNLPVPASWKRGRLSGTCKLDETKSVDEILANGSACFRDAYGSVLLVGRAKDLASGMVLDPALTLRAGLRAPLSTRKGDVTRRFMMLDREWAVLFLCYTIMADKYDRMLSAMFDGVVFNPGGDRSRSR